MTPLTTLSALLVRTKYIFLVGLRVRDGQLVPSSTMVALVKEAILNGDSGRFLLDGFPRSKDNLKAWFEVFSDHEVQVPTPTGLYCTTRMLQLDACGKVALSLL